MTGFVAYVGASPSAWTPSQRRSLYVCKTARRLAKQGPGRTRKQRRRRRILRNKLEHHFGPKPVWARDIYIAIANFS